MENQAQTSQLKSYYNCEHCGRIYKRKSSLQHHITIKHEEITLLKVKLQNEHLQLKYSLMMDQVMYFKQQFQIQENMLKTYSSDNNDTLKIYSFTSKNMISFCEKHQDSLIAFYGKELTPQQRDALRQQVIIKNKNNLQDLTRDTQDTGPVNTM